MNSNDKIILTNLGLPVELCFNNKNNINKFNRLVKKYIDDNNDILYANAPLYRLYFSDEINRKPIYEITDIKPNFVKEVINKTDEIKNNWLILNDTFNILMAVIIRDLSKRDKKYEETLNNAILYLTLSFYSSLHFKYYRKFLPNENIMNYTLNNISNKYKFKQAGTIIKALFETAKVSHDTYVKDLINGTDLDIINYIRNLHTRLNNLMKNFTDAYDKNYKNKNYINYEVDDNNAETYKEVDNISLFIERTGDEATNKFFSTNIDQKFINVSAKFSNCSAITLRKAIESIKNSEKDKIKFLILSILQVYMNDGKNSSDSIASSKFIAYCIMIYSKSNTKNINIINIKKLLDYFMKNNCNKYSDTEREATRINYRKGLYMYIVLIIQSCKISR